MLNLRIIFLDFWNTLYMYTTLPSCSATIQLSIDPHFKLRGPHPWALQPPVSDLLRRPEVNHWKYRDEAEGNHSLWSLEQIILLPLCGGGLITTGCWGMHLTFCPDSHTFLSAHLEHAGGIANTLYCGIPLGLLSSQGFSRRVIPVVFDLSVTSPTYMCSHTIRLEVRVTTCRSSSHVQSI